MAKQKKTWLENIQEGKGKEIARAFFLTYKTPTQITKEIYPEAFERARIKTQKSFIMPIIATHFKNWQKEGFIMKSKMQIPVSFFKRRVKYDKPELKVKRQESKKLSTYHDWAYLLGLEPIYKFCKERGIEFTEEEKSFLKLNLLEEDVRADILEQFPQEDIINATLKYYTKHCIMKYFYLLRDIREHPEKYEKVKLRVKELNNPTQSFPKALKTQLEKGMNSFNKKLGSKNENYKMEFDIIRVLAVNLSFAPADRLFKAYTRAIKDNRSVVPSIDKKVMSVLNIYPFNKSERFYAPTETYTFLTKERGMFLYASLYKLLLNNKQEALI